MKYLPCLIILLTSSSIYGQEIMIRGEVKGATGPIQLLAYENPFDQHINLLKEIDLNSDGTFIYSFHSNDQKNILFKVDGGTKEILVRPGNELKLTFEVKKLPKTDHLGKTNELVLIKASSNDAFENMLFDIEKDLEELKESFRKKNGSLQGRCIIYGPKAQFIQTKGFAFG